MNTKKLFVTGLSTGVLYFLLGWLVWGMALASFMESHTNAPEGLMRGDNMLMWSMVVGNVAYGLLLSYLINLANLSNPSQGIWTGFIVGLLIACAYDFIMYAQMNFFDVTSIIVDMIAMGVTSAIAMAVGIWVNQKA